jgi:hypothetical protein
MAKEIVIKVKVDGQEIDVAKMSMNELTKQIGDLKTKLEEVPIGSKDFKKIQGDIDALEKGFLKAKQSTKGFVDNLADLPGIAGLAGKSLQGIKQGFDLLVANPLVAVFTLLATVLLKVIDKMKNLEGVMDPLEKIGKAVSGVFDVLANTILPPVAAALELVAEGVTKVANFFGTLFGAANNVGDAMSYVSDTMDRLNDTNAEFELNQAKANRALQEAREIAGDATKSVGERIKALKDAEKIERDIAEKARARELDRAHAQAVELANSLGYSEQQIAAIKRYDAAQLESYLKEIQLKKGLNREKSDALYASLAKIEESAAQEAKIGKKTQSQITSLENEEKQKRVEAGKKAAEQTKDYLTRLLAFQNDTRLNNINDEQEKARVSLEIDKKKTLDEIAGLELSNKRKNALKLAALEDFASKEKILLEKQRQENEDKTRAFNYKIEQLEIDGYNDELQRQKATIDAKAYQDKIAMTKDTQFKKQTKEEQARILALIDKKAEQEKKKADEDFAKKQADLVYKQIEFERQSRAMELQVKLQQIDISNKAELDKIRERRVILDEQAKEDFDKELENLQKLLTAKEVTNEDFLKRKAVLENKYNTTIAANAIDQELKLTEQRKKNNQAVMQLADSIGALGQAMGAETDAGKALIRVQQALALATTSVAIAQAFMGLGKDLAKGFPVNIIAVASTLALIATAISQFKALTTPFKNEAAAEAGGGVAATPTIPAEARPQGYGDGGMIDGPRHAQGGTLINAEGGEAVMTRGAVTLFGPLLSQLNQLGGGRSFAPNLMVSSYDNPKSAFPSDYQQEPVSIVKTYVVETELTSAQQKQARLRDLSTI